MVVIGMRRPLQAMTWRAGLSPSARTCSRSTEEFDEARGAAGDALFAEHVPGLERVANLKLRRRRG